MANPNVGDQALERIASELLSSFPSHSTSLPAEVGVIYTSSSECKAETAVIRTTDDAIGIAYWALTPIYRAAKERIRKSRLDVRAASAMLAVNPDVGTAWNVRKRVLLAAVDGHNKSEVVNETANFLEERISAELQFAALMLTRSPKSSETWSHRAWVLRTFGWNERRVQDELKVGWKAASAASGNYYAGVQRARALDHASVNTALEEVLAGRRWLQTHVSDCSGWWYHAAATASVLMLMSCTDDAFYREEVAFAEDMYSVYGERFKSVGRYRTWLSNHARNAAPGLSPSSGNVE